MNNTQKIVVIGLLISCQIVLTRFFSIQTPVLRIGFGFLPLAVSAIIFGPITGGIIAAVSDVLGMMLFPNGVYFPGFTVSAFLSGVIYGMFLHNRNNNLLVCVVISSLLVSTLVDVVLNTIWLSMLIGKSIMILIIPRLIIRLAVVPISIILIYRTSKYIVCLREKVIQY